MYHMHVRTCIDVVYLSVIPDHVSVECEECLSQVLHCGRCEETILRECEEGGAPMSVVGPLEPLDRGEGGVRVESVQSMATAQIVEALEKQLRVCVCVGGISSMATQALNVTAAHVQ